MYDWLEEELKGIRAKKMFVFSGPTLEEEIRSFEASTALLPEGYKIFLRRYGEAKLFRHPDANFYRLHVYRLPTLSPGPKGKSLLEFGSTSEAPALFDVVGGQISPAAEGVRCGMGLFPRKVADTFEEWLQKRFFREKRRYPNKVWNEMAMGAKPFTEEEGKVASAVGKFEVRKLGVASDGKVQFQVYNGSDTLLPYLTVPLKTAKFDGAVYLDVSQIAPGQTEVIERFVYEDLVDPRTVEVLTLVPPDPEDRRHRWEFRKTRQSKPN
jgi:hypothetical protein